MANPELARTLLRWYAASPGQVLHYTDAANGINAEPKTVAASLGRMAKRHPEFGLERVGDRTGNYVYRPDRVNNPLLPAVIEPSAAETTPPKLGEVLEIVGIMADGTPLARLPGEARVWKMEQL
jgi:hypothetical protein